LALGRISNRISPSLDRPSAFSRETLRWWDHWLKGQDTGIMDEPAYRVWMEEPVRQAAYLPDRPEPLGG
jgi:hypothetical protein